jgi:hypothetical protein
MSLIWKLNGSTLESLGLTLAGGTFVANGVSSMAFTRDTTIQAAETLAYRAAAVLTYQTGAGSPVKFFQGIVTSIPKYGSPEEEGHEYIISDAWADLDQTPYQEPWGFGVVVDEEENAHVRSDIQVPRAVFGMSSAGTRISVGEVITNAITYAASVGIAIQAGSIPTGEIPLPAEVSNITIAEIIRMALLFHPDWQPWIDHTTTPPTFHVTPAASATAVDFEVGAADDVQDIRITERADLIPAAVRVVYEYAGEANVDGDPEIFRRAIVDKYPTTGPDAGPQVICASVPLAGLNMQAQKTRIYALTIATEANKSTDAAKRWIKNKYLHLRNVPNEEITISAVERELIEEPGDQAPLINPRATRLTSPDPDKYPRELIRGAIEDHMRVRVSKMVVKPTVVAAAGASAETIAAIAQGTPECQIVATNARTKIYYGPSQWPAPESVPAGIAESAYNAIVAGNRWQGSCTTAAEDVQVARLIGKKLNISGTGNSAYETMNALIHAVTWDLVTGRSTVEFGPAPYLAIQDFLELQRMFRTLPVTWFSADERTSEKYGSEDEPSARGDTVGPYHTPDNIFAPGGGGGSLAGAFFTLYQDDEGDTYLQGGIISGSHGGTATLADYKVLDATTGVVTLGGKILWAEATCTATAADGILLPGLSVTAGAYGTPATTVPANDAITYDSRTGRKLYYELGRWTDATFLPAGVGSLATQACLGNWILVRA